MNPPGLERFFGIGFRSVHGLLAKRNLRILVSIYRCTGDPEIPVAVRMRFDVTLSEKNNANRFRLSTALFADTDIQYNTGKLKKQKNAENRFGDPVRGDRKRIFDTHRRHSP
jgi:hypothetical protein